MKDGKSGTSDNTGEGESLRRRGKRGETESVADDVGRTLEHVREIPSRAQEAAEAKAQAEAEAKRKESKKDDPAKTEQGVFNALAAAPLLDWAFGPGASRLVDDAYSARQMASGESEEQRKKREQKEREEKEKEEKAAKAQRAKAEREEKEKAEAEAAARAQSKESARVISPGEGKAHEAAASKPRILDPQARAKLNAELSGVDTKLRENEKEICGLSKETPEAAQKVSSAATEMYKNLVKKSELISKLPTTEFIPMRQNDMTIKAGDGEDLCRLSKSTVDGHTTYKIEDIQPIPNHAIALRCSKSSPNAPDLMIMFEVDEYGKFRINCPCNYKEEKGRLVVEADGGVKYTLPITPDEMKKWQERETNNAANPDVTLAKARATYTEVCPDTSRASQLQASLSSSVSSAKQSVSPPSATAIPAAPSPHSHRR